MITKSIILAIALTASSLAHAGRDHWTATATPDPFSAQIVYTVNYKYLAPDTDGGPGLNLKFITISCDNYEHGQQSAVINYGDGIHPENLGLKYRIDDGEIVESYGEYNDSTSVQFGGDVIKLAEAMIAGETLYIRSQNIYGQSIDVAIPLQGFGKAYGMYCSNSS